MNSLKKTIVSIALLATLIISIASIQIQNASAADYTSYPFIGGVPNPVGVGQEVLLHVGALTALQFADDGWLGLTVTVLKPDGKTTTLNCPKTDSTGGTGLIFVPDQVGNYTLRTNFPAQNSTFRGVPTNNYYKAAVSDDYTLIVQAEPVVYYPAAPLPTEYWTRPIDAQLREWYSISGSWLRIPEGFYAPSNDAPTTPHILWQKSIGETQGGLVGGAEYGQDSFENGDAYEGLCGTQFIIAGVLYYTPYESGIPDQPLVAVDLHTGQTLWQKIFLNNARPSFAQIIDWKCMNNHGAFPYIVFQTSASGVTTWSSFDALTGNWRYNITNVPGGTNYFGALGEALKYDWQSSGSNVLRQWNQTYIVSQGKTGMSESWGSQVRGVVYNATQRPGYDHNWTVSGLNVGDTLPGRAGTSSGILRVFPGDKVIGGQVTQQAVRLWAINLKTGNEGQLLYNKTWNAPAEWVAGNITVSGFQGGFAVWSPKDNFAVLFTKENRVHYGFDLNTGEYKWKTTPQHYLDAWDDSLTAARMIANGKLYAASISGVVHCYDLADGKELWSYTAEDYYSEFQFTNSWWLRPLFVTDDYAYFGHLEHSANNPRPRGAPFLCFNATSGELIFRSDGLFRQSRWGGRAILGDSIIATQDTYNQQIYAIGKGPSKTTVTAPDIGVPQGSSVVIRGTVTDISPGTEDYALRARFPNGVPAMSDDSQNTWMGYVYKQFVRPANATGVDVMLSVIDANGNYREIGTATTDSSGTYSLQWTPDIPGKYVVIATFAGSGAYYASYDQTALAVDAAPDPTPAPTPTPASIAEQYFMPMSIGIILAIAIVGALLAILLLRKRP